MAVRKGKARERYLGSKCEENSEKGEMPVNQQIFLTLGEC